jgi:hypothetical protein
MKVGHETSVPGSAARAEDGAHNHRPPTLLERAGAGMLKYCPIQHQITRSGAVMPGQVMQHWSFAVVRNAGGRDREALMEYRPSINRLSFMSP